MNLRTTRMVDLPPLAEIREEIDWAIEHHELVRVGDLLLVSDLLRLEEILNGTVLPDTTAATREDGRQVFVYAVIDGMGFALRHTDDE